MLLGMRWGLAVILVASCGRGPATDDCGEPGRGELLAASFEEGEHVFAVTGDWEIDSGTGARHGRSWALLSEGHSGSLRTVMPARPRGRLVALGFWLRNRGSNAAGPLTVTVSTDSGLTFTDGSDPPTQYESRSHWTYTEVLFELDAEGREAWFEITAENPSDGSSGTRGWLNIDAVTVIDPLACERDRALGECIAGERLAHYFTSFEGIDDHTLSGALVRYNSTMLGVDGSDFVLELDTGTTASGAMRTSTLAIPGGQMAIGFHLTHDVLAAGTIAATASGDGGVTFGPPVSLDFDFSAAREWNHAEIILPTPTNQAGVIVELSASITASGSSSDSLWLDGVSVNEITTCP